MNEADADDLAQAAMTSEIVSAYVSRNSVPVAELPNLIRSVHAALGALVTAPAEPVEDKPVPAVPVRSAIKPDSIACLCCGRRFKSLKRHLMSEHGLTPTDYRARFELKADYPLVAPDYAQARADLARTIGLGRVPSAAVAAPAPEPVPAAEPSKRGRKTASRAA